MSSRLILLYVVILCATVATYGQWDKRFQLPTGSNTRLLHVKDNTLMLWTLGSSILRRSTDGGRTFTEVERFAEQWAMGIHNGKLFFVAEKGPLDPPTLYVSSDDGATFSSVGALPLSPNSPYIGSVFSRNGRLYVVSTTKDILHSTDEGATWTKYATPDSMGVNASFDIAGDKWAIATNVGAYLSMDAGTTWEKLPKGANNFGFASLKFVKGKLYGATYVEVAAWNGKAWEAAKLPIDKPGYYAGARDMQTDGNNLYVVAEGMTPGTGVYVLNGDRFDSVGSASFPAMHMSIAMLAVGSEEVYVAYHLRTTGEGNVYAHPKPEVSTSVNDVDQSVWSTPWPNPTSGMVTLPNVRDGRLTVYASHGEAVNVQAVDQGNHTIIDLSAHAAGIYVIRTAGRTYMVVKQ